MIVFPFLNMPVRHFCLPFFMAMAVLLSSLEMASTIFCAICTTKSGRLFSNRHCVCYFGILHGQKVASQMWNNWPYHLRRSVLGSWFRNLQACFLYSGTLWLSILKYAVKYSSTLSILSLFLTLLLASSL